MSKLIAIKTKLFLGFFALMALFLGARRITFYHPSPPSVSENQPSVAVSSEKDFTLSLVTPKTVYSLQEEIPVEVVIKGSLPLVAFQMNLQYSANLAMSKEKGEELIPSFVYRHNRNDFQKDEFLLAAFSREPQKPLFPSRGIIFTRLFFKPKATGKAVLKLGEKTGAFTLGRGENLLKKPKSLILEIVSER